MPPPSMLLTQHNFCTLVPLTSLAIFILWWHCHHRLFFVLWWHCQYWLIFTLCWHCQHWLIFALCWHCQHWLIFALCCHCQHWLIFTLCWHCQHWIIFALCCHWQHWLIFALCEHGPQRHHRALIAERLRREARSPATMPLKRPAEMGSVRFRVTTGCEVERPPAPARVVVDAATRCFCFGG